MTDFQIIIVNSGDRAALGLGLTFYLIAQLGLISVPSRALGPQIHGWEPTLVCDLPVCLSL